MKRLLFVMCAGLFLLASCAAPPLALAPQQKNFLDAALSGGDANAKDGPGNYTPIYYAAKNSDLVAVQKLLDRGADPKARFGTTGQLTVLHAVADGRFRYKNGIGPNDAALIKLFVKLGVDPNAGSQTPLHYALLTNGGTELIMDLIMAGADPNKANDYGVTPIFMADKIDQLDVLLQAGANPNIVDKQGNSVFDGFYKNHRSTYNHLVERFPDPKAKQRGEKPKKPEPLLKPGKYVWIREYKVVVWGAPPSFEFVDATLDVPNEMSKSDAINTLLPEEALRWPMGRALVLDSLTSCNGDCGKAYEDNMKKIKTGHDIRNEKYSTLRSFK